MSTGLVVKSNKEGRMSLSLNPCSIVLTKEEINVDWFSSE